jgi:outer membrane lipoprotein-sorting protein
MKTSIKAFSFAFFISLAPALLHAAADKAAAVDPVRLVNVAFDNPALPYEGRLMVTSWSGKETTAQEVNVFFLPPNRYRFEFLSPDGRVQRVVVTDGHQELIRPVRDGQEAEGIVVRGAPKLLSREEQRRLLFDNYRVSVDGTENVLGRTAYVVQLTPLADGKPNQRLTIDKETGIILEMKKDGDETSNNASVSRFVRFSPNVAAPESQFVISAALQKGDDPAAFTPRMTTIKELEQMAGGPLPIPQHLPGGFALESADFFKVRGESVQHWRYSDGLVPLSLFETKMPVRIPKEGVSAAGAASVAAPAYVGDSNAGAVRYWQSGPRHYTLIGDVSPDLLQQMDPDKEQ